MTQKYDLISVLEYDVDIIVLQAVRSYITSKPMQTGPLDALKNEKNKWPQHFIYSKADDLIPSNVSTPITF